MLIRKLRLKNFRQFIGEQEVEFSTDREKNVTVLIGLNTSGKTTFVRSFEWVLYDKKEFDNPILLNQNVIDGMRFGETQEVSGTIVLEHNGMVYEIGRRQTYTCVGEQEVRGASSVPSILYLQPDGQTKTEVGSDFISNIERILPRNLSGYFFFGGERIKEISNSDDIESSVKGLMGLDILSNAVTHLKTVIRKLKKSLDFSGDQNAYNIQQKLEEETLKFSGCDEEIKNIEEQLTYWYDEKMKNAALLKANENVAEEQRRREQLDTVIVDLTDRIERDKKELVTLFSRDAFSFFSIPLLKKALDVLGQEEDLTESVPEMTAASIDYILNRGICICGTSISEGSLAEQSLQQERKKQPPESIGPMIRRYKEQAQDYLSLSEMYYSGFEGKFTDWRSNRRDLGFRVDEKNRLDQLLLNQRDIASIETEYKRADAKIREFEEKKQQVVEKIGASKKDIAQFEKALESYGKANQKNTKISENVAYAQAVCEWVQKAYQERESIVRKSLEKKVNYNFDKMYHGNRIITIDEKYRVKYLDVTTEESDGLKAVKSFAFISGLIDLAKEALASNSSSEADVGPQYYPLVMDAPFSNVDEIHIENISKMIPKSAEQVIIAVMQKDWEPASKVMTPMVGKEYRIEKNQDATGEYIDTITYIR